MVSFLMMTEGHKGKNPFDSRGKRRHEVRPRRRGRVAAKGEATSGLRCRRDKHYLPTVVGESGKVRGTDRGVLASQSLRDQRQWGAWAVAHHIRPGVLTNSKTGSFWGHPRKRGGVHSKDYHQERGGQSHDLTSLRGTSKDMNCGHKEPRKAMEG